MRTLPIALATAAFLLGGVVVGHADDPDVLWKLVHDHCVPGQLHGNPSPCALVDVEHGYALLKDRSGPAQFLVIPTAKITGIEDPAILAPDAPNYFALAWRARTQVEARLRRALPRDPVSLAINATTGRTQNQLHIHVDCINATVRTALHGAGATIGPHWAPLPVPLAGHAYQAMRVSGKYLATVNPFRLLATGVPGATADMGHHTLVVTGTTMPDGLPGFILLDDHTNSATGDLASGEELQDHACSGLAAPPRRKTRGHEIYSLD